ncbi:MAG: glycosyltransferase family 4 protein [Propionibacteriaceae bacterium]|nr:glycosyltransferase family 4 protein [Propionibacteriaceae bacterium]
MLHVVECYAGGVKTAVDSYVANSPDFTHFLLYSNRGSGSEPSLGFAASAQLRHGHWKRIADIRRAVLQWQPDLIHAHSTYAGVYCRVRNTGRPVVYTPHCYAYERLDLGSPSRTLIRGVERALASRTAVLVGCSEREADLSIAIGHKSVVFVPNVASIAPVPKENPRSHDLTVAFVGRLCPQKDPAFAAAVVARLRTALNKPFTAIWIGDGEADQLSLLSDAGIECLGWLPPQEVAAALAAATLYIHTAAWEGYPLSILEAIASGVAVIARRIPAFTAMPDSCLGANPTELADLAVGALLDQQRLDTLWTLWAQAVKEWTPQQQSTLLKKAYRQALPAL